jgi:hypothetical protein
MVTIVVGLLKRTLIVAATISLLAVAAGLLLSRLS